MRISAIVLTLLISGVCYPQTPEISFTLATHSVSADTTWGNWKVLLTQKLKVSFRFSATTIKMILPLRTETLPIVQKFRKNGAIIYLVKDSQSAKGILILNRTNIRYIVKTNANRFFQTCYRNVQPFTYEANLP